VGDGEVKRDIHCQKIAVQTHAFAFRGSENSAPSIDLHSS